MSSVEAIELIAHVENCSSICNALMMIITGVIEMFAICH